MVLALRKLFLASVGCMAVCTAANAERFDATDILLDDVTGNVKITTTGGDAIEVVIKQGKTYHSVAVSASDGVVTLKGEEWREDEGRQCCDNRIKRTVNNRNDRTASTGKPIDEGFFAEYPTIEIKMPRSGDATFIDARMTLAMESIDGALNLDACYVYGEAGDADEAVLGVVDGSRLVMGDIKSGLEIDVSGDADVMTGSAAIADIDIAGPGDVILGNVDGMLDVTIAGSGVVRASRIEGPVDVRIAGSGVVAIKGGRAEKLRATIDGSGAIFMEGATVSPELRLFGSSEVRLASVDGRITHHGRGEVYVDDKLIEKKK